MARGDYDSDSDIDVAIIVVEYQIADSAAPIKDDGGRIIGVVLVFRDITEEYKIQKEIFEAKELLESTMDAIPDAIELDNPKTVDLRLISALVEQLDGTIKLKRKPYPEFTIQIPFNNDWSDLSDRESHTKDQGK